MVVFAGEVFPEWYWGPIFFTVLFSPAFVAAAVGTDVVARRLRGPLPLSTRAGLWILAAVLTAGVILAFSALRNHWRFEQRSSAVAESFGFTVHRPAALPAGWHEEQVRAQEGYRLPYLVSRYRIPGAPYAFAFQQEPGEISLQSGTCSARDLQGSSSNFFDGPCKELRTASGRAVYVGGSRSVSGGSEAYGLLDGALVRLEYQGLPQAAVLAWFDSLRPVKVENVDFKG